MNPLWIDLRSDTVTQPSAEMRRAMAAAEVDDDVYGEDPTINRLEARAAEVFAREAAIFVPSGTMGNQIAVKLHTRPGQEVLCEERGHIFNYEMAMPAWFSGCLVRPVSAPQGILSWELLAPKIARPPITSRRPASSRWRTPTTWRVAPSLPSPPWRRSVPGPMSETFPCTWMARASSTPQPILASRLPKITRSFDSVMFCLSKGLGAPVGSMLVGSREFIEQARSVRKALGGGMRQAGILAAAGLIALEQVQPACTRTTPPPACLPKASPPSQASRSTWPRCRPTSSSSMSAARANPPRRSPPLSRPMACFRNSQSRS